MKSCTISKFGPATFYFKVSKPCNTSSTSTQTNFPINCVPQLSEHYIFHNIESKAILPLVIHKTVLPEEVVEILLESY